MTGRADANPLSGPARTLVFPSVLSADFARLGDDARAAMSDGGDGLHVDVMDGHFVPNLSMGPVVCEAIHRAVPGAFLDVHLMVTDPARWIDAFARAGAGHLQFHAEVVPDPCAMARAIHDAGMTAGIVINPGTPAEACFGALGCVETVMLMSVHPGRSGQAFIPEVLAKAPAIASRLRPGQRIMLDGGVSPSNAAACRAAGCSVLIGGSAIFGSPDRAAAIAGMRGPAPRP